MYNFNLVLPQKLKIKINNFGTLICVLMHTTRKINKNLNGKTKLKLDLQCKNQILIIEIIEIKMKFKLNHKSEKCNLPDNYVRI